jgi:hypothetical protein
MKSMSRGYGAVLPLILLALLGGSLGACGGERKFTAQEFVEEVGAEGVQINLGEDLTTTETGVTELRAVELEPLVGAPPVPGEGPASGSLAVYEDTDGASDRLGECRDSADLLCYQAANVVVILDQGGIEADRLGVAMQKLAE